jgi:hypothetical protein
LGNPVLNRKPVVLDEPIKIEGYLRIRREGGTIILEPSRSVYLLVPSEIVKLLTNDYGVNLKDKKSGIYVECSLLEDDSDPEHVKLRLVYDIHVYKVKSQEPNRGN